MTEGREELYSGPTCTATPDQWMTTLIAGRGYGKGFLIAQQVRAQVKGQAETQGEWVKA